MVQPEIIACFVQTLLYGVYLVSSSHCLQCLVWDTERRKLRSKIHWPITTVTVVLFVLMTANLAAGLRLVLFTLEGQSSSFTYVVTFVVASAIGVAVHLIVDGVLIYRCWIIYRHSWLTVIPLLASLWIADLIAAIIGLVFLASNQGLWPGAEQQNSIVYKYGLSVNMIYFLCEIAINIYATSAITFKITRATRWGSGRHSGPLHKIGLILAESGILFTTTCVLALCLRVMAMNTNRLQLASLLMNDINFNVAALTFNMILIRINKEMYQPPSEAPQDNTSKPTIMLTTVQFDTSTSSTQATEQGPSEPELSDNVA